MANELILKIIYQTLNHAAGLGDQGCTPRKQTWDRKSNPLTFAKMDVKKVDSFLGIQKNCR
ncbi:MAG: hypothetical protein M0P70_13540 [Desulfobulbaceae bacterium]|nr:hypothetical protein [Desulfobulbaceae bacterium]